MRMAFSVAGRAFDDQSRRFTARVVGVDRGDGAQTGRLLLNRGDQLGVLMTDVDVHQLAREVEVSLAVLVPEPAALGAGDDDRADHPLGRPRVEHVGAIVGESLRGAGVEHGHGVSLFVTTTTEQIVVCDRTMKVGGDAWCHSLLRSSAWAR
jgi:hypothetical protein